MAQNFQINPILNRLGDADSDFRFMALNDLLALLNGPSNQLQTNTADASRLIEGVLKALDDGNGEVQNLAVKCLAPLSLKIKETQLTQLLDRLASLTTTASDPSIPCTALRLVISALPRYATAGGPTAAVVNAASTSVQRSVLPKLLVMLKPGHDKKDNGGISVDAVDVLIDILRYFGEVLSTADLEKLQKATLVIIESDRCSSVVKKRAVTALSLLCVHAPDELLSKTVTHIIQKFRTMHVSPAMQRLLVATTGAFARTIPKRFGPYLKTLAPFIVAVVDGHDLGSADDDDDESEQNAEVDEVREGALSALDSFHAFCPEDMKWFMKETIDAALRFIVYDPNYATNEDDDEDDEEMGGTQTNGEDDEDDEDQLEDDDEFENDEAFSDDDDVSWKVRRCAAKLLSTVSNTKMDELLQDVLYKRVAPVLVKRFDEREENVRLEVLATTTNLIKKTGDGSGSVLDARIISHKRRRGSDSSMMEVETPMAPPAAPTGRQALVKLLPRIGKSSAKLLKGKSLSTKQATINLLATMINVSTDVSTILPLVLDPVLTIIGEKDTSSSGSGSTGASGTVVSASSLRIEAMKFTSLVIINEPVEIVQPFLGKLVAALTSTVDDRFYKITSQALASLIDLVNQLTPEIAAIDPQYIVTIYESIYTKATQGDADMEVRERAIEALGYVLSKTAGNQYLNSELRNQGLVLVLERLRNETTRLAAARTIERIASAAQPGDLQQDWVDGVIGELGDQLRKSNRALRGSSVVALWVLLANPAAYSGLQRAVADNLVGVLTPLITPNDLHLCGPALQILTNLVGLGIKLSPSTLPPLIEAVGSLGKAPLGGAVRDSLLGFVEALGTQGQGAELMAKYIAMFKEGETAVMAKVIGTLLVSGTEGQYSVSLQNFASEVDTAPTEKGKCLALMVLGEAGLRMKGKFSIGPDIFLSQFRSKLEEVPIAAATALGLAAAGNPASYMPAIMKQFEQDNSRDQYLLLHSYKEIVQHSTDNPAGISPYTPTLWKHLFVVSRNDENKSVAAECVGRLTMIDPASFMPSLQQALSSPSPPTRAMVISAVRYTFTDSHPAIDPILAPILPSLLSTMINDPEIENRKLALTTINSAAHNKSHLLTPFLPSLMSHVYRETAIRPDLIREVQMGPFKHKVDDGLDCRKTAYETLFAFVDTCFPRLNEQEVFDRVIAGAGDEHDIKVICNLMLNKLVLLATEETTRRLDDVSERFKLALTTKPKENAVKQENEKFAELTRSILRTTIILNRECSGASGVVGSEKGWKGYYEWAKTSYKTEFVGLEKEDEKRVGGSGTVE